MATTAQTLANQANAQRSTGPRTEAGKSASSRNATTHGLSSGVLIIAPEDRPEFDALKAALIQETNPSGALEMDALAEFLDAAWRLRQIRKIVRDLALQPGADPAAALRQLTRYRAAAEMSLHRAINTLRDLQTLRIGRLFHLAKSENEAIGPLASPSVFAFQVIEGVRMNRIARENFDTYHGVSVLASNGSFTNSNPIPGNSAKIEDGSPYEPATN